jgi:hypothetical protein
MRFRCGSPAITTERTSGTRTHQPSLLAGMLFDTEGNRMTPSYAVKQGRRYRYYVSAPADHPRSARKLHRLAHSSLS